MKINTTPATVVRAKTTLPVDAQGNVVGSKAAAKDPKQGMQKTVQAIGAKAPRVARYNVKQPKGDAGLSNSEPKLPALGKLPKQKTPRYKQTNYQMP